MTNTEFAQEDGTFIWACGIANTEPTKRQAGKFRRGTGIAHKAMRFLEINTHLATASKEEALEALKFAGLRK